MFRRSGTLKPVVELLFLVFVVGWVPCHVGRIAFEEIWHEDLVGVLAVAVGEDISALNSLRKEAEDVVNGEDGRSGSVWAGHI